LPASVLGGAPVYAPSRHQIATTSGLITQGSQLGQVIGPPVLALIVSAGGGWKAAPWLLASSAVVGVCLAASLGLLERSKTIAE
jgi:MFS family permease